MVTPEPALRLFHVKGWACPKNSSAGGAIIELRATPRNTRMRSSRIRPLTFSPTRRGHESKNHRTDARNVHCWPDDVLRCRRIYGHLEPERSQIENNCRKRNKQHRGVPGRG